MILLNKDMLSDADIRSERNLIEICRTKIAWFLWQLLQCSFIPNASQISKLLLFQTCQVIKTNSYNYFLQKIKDGHIRTIYDKLYSSVTISNSYKQQRVTKGLEYNCTYRLLFFVKYTDWLSCNFLFARASIDVRWKLDGNLKRQYI